MHSTALRCWPVWKRAWLDVFPIITQLIVLHVKEKMDCITVNNVTIKLEENWIEAADVNNKWRNQILSRLAKMSINKVEFWDTGEICRSNPPGLDPDYQRSVKNAPRWLPSLEPRKTITIDRVKPQGTSEARCPFIFFLYTPIIFHLKCVSTAVARNLLRELCLFNCRNNNQLLLILNWSTATIVHAPS